MESDRTMMDERWCSTSGSQSHTVSSHVLCNVISVLCPNGPLSCHRVGPHTHRDVSFLRDGTDLLSDHLRVVLEEWPHISSFRCDPLNICLKTKSSVVE